MTLAAQSWRQTGADVILVAGIVSAVLLIWAKVFAGPIGRWFDARASAVAKATVEPLALAVGEMRSANENARTVNTAQHAEVRAELHSLRTDVSKLTDRLDGHIDAANEWRSGRQGDGR